MKNYRKVIQENTDKEDGAGVHSFPMTSMSTKSPEKVTYKNLQVPQGKNYLKYRKVKMVCSFIHISYNNCESAS